MNPVVLRYQIGPDEILAKETLINGDSWRRVKWGVWKDTLLFVALCILGLLAAYMANSVLLMFIFGIALLARLTVPFEHKSKFKAGLAAIAEKQIRRRNVSLTIDDEGLLEEVEGVRSSAPWHTVKTYTKVDKVWFIELCGELWAVIPDIAFLAEGAPSEADFVAILKSKGVPERNNEKQNI